MCHHPSIKRQRLADRLIVAAAYLAILAFAALPTRAEDTARLVVSGYGGTYQDAQRKAIYEPFEKATGIKVVAVVHPGLPKLTAMVQTKNVEIDVVEAAGPDAFVLQDKGFLEKIDYSGFDKETLSELHPEAIKSYGVGDVFYSQVIAYNTKAFSQANHPRSWAEFWDTKKFPGPRILAAGSYAVPPIELALMADGVPPDKLYPLDLNRAYKKLREIRPNVVKWSESVPIAVEALVSGEAVLAQLSQARVSQLKAQGAPIDYEWNQQLVQMGFWVVLKGAKNTKNAMKFIAFASQAKQQAALATIIPQGPTNRRALELLPEKIRADLPSAPQNMKGAAITSAESWGKKDSSGRSDVERNLQMWNSFITSR